MVTLTTSVRWTRFSSLMWSITHLFLTLLSQICPVCAKGNLWHMHFTLIRWSKINKVLCQPQNFHVALLIEEGNPCPMKVAPKQSEATGWRKCWNPTTSLMLKGSSSKSLVSSLWTAVPLILERGLNHFGRTLLCSRVSSLLPARIWTAYSISNTKDARLRPKQVLKHSWDQKINQSISPPHLGELCLAVVFTWY